MKSNIRLATIMVVTVASLFLVAQARGVTCTYESTDVPKDIPDLGTILSSLDVPHTLKIVDLDVVLNITHTYVDDLDVFLIAPNGTQVELFTDIDSCDNNFENTRLDDEASVSITKGSAPFTGSFKPEGRLSALDGLAAQGTWKLKIADDLKWDSGKLKSWRLIIDFGPDPSAPANPNPAHDARGASLDTCLTWDKDPVSADTTWDLYMVDPNGVMQLAAADLTEPNFCPGPLNIDTWYTWQVVAKRACVETIGPLWLFKTAAPPSKIIWVSFHGADDVPSAGAAGVGFTVAPDKGYTDLLKANGYDVTRYIQTATPDVNMLNAADLVIVSRSVASSSFQNVAATRWNTTVSAPMIIVNGYTIRQNRMGFATGNTIPDITGDITLTVNDLTHPIFAGIPLTDSNMTNPYAGIVLYPDGTTKALGISIVTNPPNANGTVLATVSAASAATGPAGAMVIAEWQAGATVTHAGGAGTDTLAGHRLVFLTGSREASGKSSEGTGMFDLYPDGAQMFLNAVKYMLAKEPIEIPVENFSFELPGTEKIVGWNGEGTPAVDIPGWSSDTAALDSGVESDWPGRTEGLWSGFLMGTDPSIWNPLNYVIKPGDDIVLLVDARDNWTAAAALPAKLEMTIYRLVDGQRTPLVTNTVELTTTWTTYSLEFKANDVPELIGSALGGIELKNVSNATPDNNSWIGLDNVGLFDVSGEP